MNMSKKINELSYIEFENFLNNTETDTLLKIKEKASKVYYNGKDTYLSDAKYDLLETVLKSRKIELDIGYLPDNNREPLPVYMGSMDKIKEDDEKAVQRWKGKNVCKEYLIEEKIDGVSCLYVCEKGVVKLFTRGNGKVGSNVSNYLKYIKNIPKNDSDIIIRGELVIKHIDFPKYKEEYSNPRNMVSGLINSKTYSKAYAIYFKSGRHSSRNNYPWFYTFTSSTACISIPSFIGLFRNV